MNDLTALYTNRIVVDDQVKGPFDTPSRAVWNAKEAFKRHHQNIVIQKKVNGDWTTNEEAMASFRKQCAELKPEDMVQPKQASKASKTETLSTSLSYLARVARFMSTIDQPDTEAIKTLKEAIQAVQKQLPK